MGKKVFIIALVLLRQVVPVVLKGIRLQQIAGTDADSLSIDTTILAMKGGFALAFYLVSRMV